MTGEHILTPMSFFFPYLNAGLVLVIHLACLNQLRTLAVFHCSHDCYHFSSALGQ